MWILKATGDQAAKIADAIYIGALNADFDGTNHTEAEIHFNVGDYVKFPAAYFGFVLLNDGTGAALGASTNDGDYQSVKVAAA